MRRWGDNADQRLLGVALLLMAMAAAAVLTLWLERGQTLLNDEWNFVANYRPWTIERILTPANGHLFVVPLLIWKSLFSTVGISSHVPFRLVALSLNLLVAGLIYIYARRRIGPLLALAPAVLLLFYGAGWDMVVATWGMTNTLALALGIGALLLLERGDRIGDASACALLALVLGTHGMGFAFVAAAAVALALRGPRIALGRTWVVLLPVALYAVWFIWARKFGQGTIYAYSSGVLISGIADQLAAITSGIVGLFTTPGAPDLNTKIGVRTTWGTVLVASLAVAIWARIRRFPVQPTFWVACTALGVYLALVALGLGPGRGTGDGRYVYTGTVLMMLFLAELAAGVPVRRPAAIALIIALGFSLAANVTTLNSGASLLRLEAQTNRAQLGALELIGEDVSPEASLEWTDEPTQSHADMLFNAGFYFDFSSEFGTPAFSEAEISETSEHARQSADLLFSRDLPIMVTRLERLKRAPGADSPIADLVASAVVVSHGSCLRIVPERGIEGSAKLILSPGGVQYSTADRATPRFALARFADSPAVVPSLQAGSGLLKIPTDRSSRPWRLDVATSEPITLCGISNRT